VSELRDSWSLLDPPREGLLIREVPSKYSRAPATLAVDPLGRHHLLLSMPAGVSVVEDRRSSGVQILEEELEDRGRRRRFADVVCLKQHLLELFDVIAEEILEEAADSARPDIAAATVLEAWRELLEAEGRELAGPERLAGLFCELWHLRRILEIDLSRLSVWTGPLGGRHDFVSGAASLEVKATLIRHGRFFRMSSHDQLDPPANAPLFLGAMKLERRPDGASVSRVLGELQALGGSRPEIVQLARGAGFSDVDLAQDDVKFVVAEVRHYEVTSNFPGLATHKFVASHLPAGTIGVRYTLDLTGEPPVPLDDDGVAQLFQSLARP
jgi:putative PD-(D/E)XK family protein DUF4420